MTFASFANPVSHIIFDQPNESAKIADITSPVNAVLDRLQLFFYKQGAASGTVQLSLVTGSKTHYTDTISLGSISGNQIGRIRFIFQTRPVLTASTAYGLYATFSSYTPVLTETPTNDVYFSLMRDYPVVMAYSSTPTSRSASPIAVHFIESV
jgi:hypothetical protein